MTKSAGLLTDDMVATPSGLVLPQWVAEERYNPEPLVTGIDLFAGCGGFSLGFIQAGFRIIAAAEWDPTAAITYMTNLCRWGQLKIHFVEDEDERRLEKALERSYRKTKTGELVKEVPVAGDGWIMHEPPTVPGVEHFFLGDVRKLTGAEILEAIEMERGEVGCVFGGPPCQGFSYSGKRNIMDPRNSLVLDFARLVVEINPTTMCMENVPGILNMITPEGVPVMDAVARILEDGSFQGFDAFRRALAWQNGEKKLVGITRGLGRQRDRGKRLKTTPKKKAPTMPTADGQLDLFTSSKKTAIRKNAH